MPLFHLRRIVSSFNAHPAANLQYGVVNHVDVSLTDTPAPTAVLKDHRSRLEMKRNGSSCDDN